MFEDKGMIFILIDMCVQPRRLFDGNAADRDLGLIYVRASVCTKSFFKHNARNWS